MNVQVIEKNGQIEWAVIPYDEYQEMLDAMEMLADIRAYDEAKAAIQAGEELIPSEIVYALLDGENPVRVWREYRGVALADLAGRAGISLFDLAQIEAGKQQPATDILAQLAEILRVEPVDLVETSTADTVL